MLGAGATLCEDTCHVVNFMPVPYSPHCFKKFLCLISKILGVGPDTQPLMPARDARGPPSRSRFTDVAEARALGLKLSC